MKISRVSPMTTISSAKRDSASYSSAVGMEKVEFSPLKKYKVDEEDDVYIESETESEESERSQVYQRFQNIPKPNPEWDVDSFEGLEWESDDELRASFSDDEDYESWRAERVKALEDRGFLPDPWNHIYEIRNLDGPGCRNMTNREYLASHASLCVKKLNEEKGKTVEFVSIVRGNMTVGSTWKLYITFMAKESPDGPLLEYQAKSMDFCAQRRPPFPILCRPVSNDKPTI